MGNVLLVEDHLHIRTILRAELEAESFKVDEAPDLKTAIWKLEQGQYDVVIMDLKLPDGISLSLFDTHREKLAFKSIVITANATIPSAVEAIRKGAFNYLEKPVDPEVLTAQANKIIDINRATQRNRKVLDDAGAYFTFDSFIYRSRAMEELISRARVLAQTDNIILIQGETGCGKELLAHSIHNESRRKANIFLPVNCASIPGELFESELFGFEKGAFTGAVNSYTGRFIQADTGSLFMDEVGELPMNFQAKLLRVLDERRIYRLKSREPISLDVRLITATNRDLQKEVKMERFRSDLLFRLQESMLIIPPLRERVEDIIPLAQYFIDIYNHIYNREVNRISADVETFFMNYPWTGNIRELRNTIKSIIPFKRDNLIRMDDLSYAAVSRSDSINRQVLTLAENEKKHFQRVLTLSNYNVQRGAKLLGITRARLYRKMKEYNLGPGEADVAGE
ncbi:MAG: sigma-54-dependent Fis family transcriptional regulator [bacterium]|nr:sigma-54-dependent Fis family transcriptional regulator [bacterium]